MEAVTSTHRSRVARSSTSKLMDLPRKLPLVKLWSESAAKSASQTLPSQTLATSLALCQQSPQLNPTACSRLQRRNTSALHHPPPQLRTRDKSSEGLAGLNFWMEAHYLVSLAPAQAATTDSSSQMDRSAS
jgi:hypothetical protein